MTVKKILKMEVKDMNKTVLVIILALVLIAGIMFYVFDYTGQENEDSEIRVEDNNLETDNTQDDIEQTNDLLELDIGDKAPDFTLENLDGEKLSLEDYRGKNVLINFWTTWCRFCVKEMPDFQKLYDEYKDDDFTILAVNGGETKSKVTEFMDQNGYNFPVLLDTKGKVGVSYMVFGIPTSYIVDKEGIIRNIKVRPMSYSEIKQIIEGL